MGENEVTGGNTKQDNADAPAVQWQLDRPKWSQQNRYLLEKQMWTDCVFVVGTSETKRFECHKFLLGKSSPVFEAMLFRPLDDDDKVEIQVPDIEPETFQAMIQFLYSGTVVLPDVDFAMELLCAADKYMLIPLRKFCSEAIMMKLSVEEAVRAFELAKLMDLENLREHAWKMIIERTDQVLATTNFLQASPDTLLTIVQQDSLHLSSEAQLISACTSWATSAAERRELETDTKGLREALGDIFKHLRFLSLTHLEFIEGPAQTNILTSDEKINIVIKITCPIGNFKYINSICDSTNNRILSDNTPKFIFSNDTSRCHKCSYTPKTDSNIGYILSVSFQVNCNIVMYGIIVPYDSQKWNMSIYDKNNCIRKTGGITLSKVGTNLHLIFNNPILIYRNDKHRITYFCESGQSISLPEGVPNTNCNLLRVTPDGSVSNIVK